MFNNIGKQVLILKNIESKMFDEVIFIIKDDTKHQKRDLLEECERIINQQNHLLTHKRKNKIKALILSIISALVILVIALIVYLSIV